MVIPSNSTYKAFGIRYYNSIDGLRLQRNFYNLRRVNLLILKNRGIKTYEQFSKLFHKYIAFIDPLDIYNYWEGITFKEVMNDYIGHIISVMNCKINVR